MALTPSWGIYYDDPDMLALGNTQDTRQADSIERALNRIASANASVALAGTEDITTLSTAPGWYEVRSASVAQALGLPTSTTGLLLKRTIGTITLLEWVAAEGDQSIWVKSKRKTTDWTEWTRIGPTTDDEEQFLPVSGGVGYKIVPLAFSLPAAPATITQTTGAARWVRSYAHAPTRIRVHISNRNPGNQNNGGAVNLLGVKVGKGTATGELSEMVDAFGAVTLASDGSEAVSSWIECPAEDGDYLGVTVGWEAAGTLQRLDSGGWTKNVSSGWDSATVDGWTHTAFMPFYLWVEAEVPASVPVVVGLGDSITVGRASTDPVQDSWLSVYCRKNQAMPLFFAQSGSSMLHWVPSDPRWEMYYPGVELAADSLINFLGQNNMLDGQSLEQHKTRYEIVKQAIDEIFPGIAFYVGGVTPSVSKSDEVTAVRREFNDWLRTLPLGARGYFDFPAAVGDEADRVLKPEFAGDNLHPNTAGHAAMGDMVLAAPVSPFVLSEKQTRALSEMVGIVS